MSTTITLKQLPAIEITSDNFKPYGQLIIPSKDGKIYDETDAQLNLANGIPRFYIMHLKKRGRQFNHITRHGQCTQCLGSLEGKEWLMAFAPPENKNYPDIMQLKAFKIPGNCFIKLEVGTWHAGPHFDHDFVDFYNLELSDTNVIDHFTYNFNEQDHLRFEIVL
ncbi:ureidoglycolate lyase [Aphanothece sacrum]|nr:ureidoglycolate lyase [Aphanothece sacrum]